MPFPTPGRDGPPNTLAVAFALCGDDFTGCKIASADGLANPLHAGMNVERFVKRDASVFVLAQVKTVVPKACRSPKMVRIQSERSMTGHDRKFVVAREVQENRTLVAGFCEVRVFNQNAIQQPVRFPKAFALNAIAGPLQQLHTSRC